ncbi:hypothetical protein [Leifsonia sp. LS1]|uniref:hypothetical protein n=1 Tax=Leifsonia sp. LS1 TaxID=2828483 RepID=UPI001CFEAE2A|nr:hypothetical protein [Leifsonia sp. LS1]
MYRWGDENATQVAISGDLIAVTHARTVDVMRVDETGAILKAAEVRAPDGALSFGSAIALDEAGGRMYIGAYGNSQAFEYLLDESGGYWRWHLARTFVPPGGINARGFGEALFLRGDELAIGAFGADGGSGAVFLVDLAAGTVQRAGVTGLYTDALLGDEVLLTDDYLIAGAHGTRKKNPAGQRVETGGVYVWDRHDLSAPKAFIDHPLWDVPENERKTFYSGATGGSSGGFGYQIAATETDLFVSSPGEISYTADDTADPNGGANNPSIDSGTSTQGAVYRFSLADLQPIGSKIVPPPHTRKAGLNMVAEGNALLLSGLTRNDGSRGQIQVYDISTLATSSSPGDLMRQQPEAVQVLEGSDVEPDDEFGGNILAGALRVEGGRAIIASSGAVGNKPGKAYLFSPIIPNVTEWPMTVDAPSIVYGQEGRIAASVPGLGVPVTVQLELNGEQHEAGTDASGTAVFDFGPAEHPAGTYPAEVSFVAPGGRDTGTATTDYVVAKAPTAVVGTNVEVR